MTIPNDVLLTLHATAAAVVEADEPAAVSRLLERLSARDDAAELRDALCLLGARALVADARALRQGAR